MWSTVYARKLYETAVGNGTLEQWDSLVIGIADRWINDDDIGVG